MQKWDHAGQIAQGAGAGCDVGSDGYVLIHVWLWSGNSEHAHQAGSDCAEKSVPFIAEFRGEEQSARIRKSVGPKGKTVKADFSYVLAIAIGELAYQVSGGGIKRIDNAVTDVADENVVAERAETQGQVQVRKRTGKRQWSESRKKSVDESAVEIGDCQGRRSQRRIQNRHAFVNCIPRTVIDYQRRMLGEIASSVRPPGENRS